MSDDNEIKIGDRVELKPGFEEFFPLAMPGGQGIIADAKIDDDGFYLVYVKWDPDHWKYNGQPNGWTYATHFNVLDEPNVINEMIENAKDRVAKEDQMCPSCGVVHTDEERDDVRLYLDILAEGTEMAAFGDGFLLITVNSHRDALTGKTRLEPEIYMKSLSDEAPVLIENEILRLALSLQDFADMTTDWSTDELGREDPPDPESD